MRRSIPAGAAGFNGLRVVRNLRNSTLTTQSITVVSGREYQVTIAGANGATCVASNAFTGTLTADGTNRISWPNGTPKTAASDEDIPSILTELDDQLASSKPEGITPSTDVEMEPLDEEYEEDDTFTMSLDLARAYLEIGDQEGARDMLKQALSGAHDPEHRRQIEELLQQID